jgi:ketosteroid isomerase-like protein
MSQENVEPVRQRLSGRERPARTRTIEERLAVRFPWLAQGWSRLIVRLSPASRLRQALMLRAIRNGFDAYNRDDLDVCVLIYHPDVKFERSEEHRAVGLEVRFQGLEGYREFAAEWTSGWGEHRFEPRELIDLGDRFLVLTKLIARGEGSGISLTQDHAMLATFDNNGRVIRQHDFLDHAEALAAVGLRE